jgi:hypothetical protein
MSNSENSPQANYLDRVLLEFGPERVMMSTLLGVAPTHVAKTNLEKKTQRFGVACKTVHSAFLKPKFPPAVADAVSDLEDMFSQFPQIHAKHIPDHEARFKECVATLKKIRPDRVEEFKTHLKETRSAETALAQVGVNVLELADGWELNPDRKFQPLLTVLDETSMVPARTILDIVSTTTLVACGDSAQLPAVESAENGSDKLNVVMNGLEAAAGTAGAVKHEFVENYRLKSDAPVLVEVMSALRRAASATDGSAPSEVALALSLIRQNKGGVTVVNELSAADAASIMRGENVALAWKNATRHWLLDAARASIGLNNDAMIIGEPVIPTLRTRDNREVVAAVQGAEIWHFAGDEFGNGFGDFEWTSNDDQRRRIRLNYAFEYREDRAYSRLGNFRGCEATLAFGYVRTVHKAQGRQWPRVFISMSDVLNAHAFFRGKGQLRDFIRWLYTAVSRAEHDVVFFHEWPLALPYDEVNSVRETLAANITTHSVGRHKGPFNFDNSPFRG